MLQKQPPFGDVDKKSCKDEHCILESCSSLEHNTDEIEMCADLIVEELDVPKAGVIGAENRGSETDVEDSWELGTPETSHKVTDISTVQAETTENLLLMEGVPGSESVSAQTVEESSKKAEEGNKSSVKHFKPGERKSYEDELRLESRNAELFIAGDRNGKDDKTKNGEGTLEISGEVYHVLEASPDVFSRIRQFDELERRGEFEAAVDIPDERDVLVGACDHTDHPIWTVDSTGWSDDVALELDHTEVGKDHSELVRCHGTEETARDAGDAVVADGWVPRRGDERDCLIEDDNNGVTNNGRDCVTVDDRDCATGDDRDNVTDANRDCVTEVNRDCVTVNDRVCVTKDDRDCVTVDDRDCVTGDDRDGVTDDGRDGVTKDERDCVTEEDRDCITVEGRDGVTEDDRDVVTDNDRDCVTVDDRDCVAEDDRDCITVEGRDGVTEDDRDVVTDDDRDCVTVDDRDCVTEDDRDGVTDADRERVTDDEDDEGDILTEDFGYGVTENVTLYKLEKERTVIEPTTSARSESQDSSLVGAASHVLEPTTSARSESQDSSLVGAASHVLNTCLTSRTEAVGSDAADACRDWKPALDDGGSDTTKDGENNVEQMRAESDRVDRNAASLFTSVHSERAYDITTTSGVNISRSLAINRSAAHACQQASPLTARGENPGVETQVLPLETSSERESRRVTPPATHGHRACKHGAAIRHCRGSQSGVDGADWCSDTLQRSRDAVVPPAGQPRAPSANSRLETSNDDGDGLGLNAVDDPTFNRRQSTRADEFYVDMASPLGPRGASTHPDGAALPRPRGAPFRVQILKSLAGLGIDVLVTPSGVKIRAILKSGPVARNGNVR